MPHALIPAGTLHAQLLGLQVLGLDDQAVREALGSFAIDPAGHVPVSAYAKFWDLGFLQYPHEGFPTALARAIPFGAFGMLDYLTASASTAAGGCESLALHFRIVAQDTRLEIEVGDDLIWLNIHLAPHVPAYVGEFTIATIASRLRLVCGDDLLFERVTLPTAPPVEAPSHGLVYGPRVVYGAAQAALAMSPAQWQATSRQPDPFLHQTLKSLAQQLSLGLDDSSSLEQPLRARLRDALATGEATPARMAQLLGLSERTLQRRLADEGRSFTEVVDEFRHQEALRLLLASPLAIVKVAAQLGFSEQTSFNRAFKRWTGGTPAAWRQTNRAN